MRCDRCGDCMPEWAAHTAGDGDDVCSACCDVCKEEETMDEKPMSGVLAATQHWWAHGITAEVDTSDARPILHVRTADGMGWLALSGSITDMRAVGWAILAAADRMGE